MFFRGSLRNLPSAFRSARRGAASMASASTHAGSGSGSHGSRRLLWAAVPAAFVTGAALTYGRSTDDDAATARSNIASIPTTDLVRAYLVYTACGIPALVDAAPVLLDAFAKSPIPGISAVANAVIRRTFFNQFVAGEDLPETMETISRLNSRGIGGLLNYGAEADLGEGNANDTSMLHEHNYRQDVMAVEALGEYERLVAKAGGKTGSSQFAVKISGLIDYAVLERASTTLCRLRPVANDQPQTASITEIPFPGVPQRSDAAIIAPAANATAVVPTIGAFDPQGILATDLNVTDADMVELNEFWRKMRSLGALARDNGVKLLIDAEHAETQPAMDALTLLMSQEFNRPEAGKPFTGPIVFGTYQSYLARAPYLLDAMIADAEANGYALGVKLVRGAYNVADSTRWIKEGRSGTNPIWPNKPATDLAYNSSVSKIVDTMARQLDGPNPELAVSAVYATHNPKSVEHVLNELERTGLASRQVPKAVEEHMATSVPALVLRDDVRGKVFVAQLYGMRDDLTDKVAETLDSDGLPVALKYIAYGKYEEVLPYLARRAMENKSVMTGEGGAAMERKRVITELWRRWTGGPATKA
ncbi:hypothetical protein CcaverHIS002_0210750 [Cutaneotrichosporon cavernicola]|uniref:Proline dehydrogenase n=1 Tax=Cutaneotrichosporon cavernicola TaxID=279322 RepID=A0AA48IG43_9TREE|nr:uncharacterized protein CcaverHIS019_0210750 [Cutaneotrichosporon cavernicola]BEI81915.1 hypothetical protein CcaverHIS002_0210750 [Cutaneotrichosporon cavernicola]BEI89713.1 hypothetical protein CcaverHIS019_0210750 [Cutaneotrichosporon cavernicola]BEI97484.1 hypothetical protein CcaverHIS631_0210730 [Cutaneotrichosporon cavernicola]BEJ05262.1 hypothetical protein CcaverHIS641_0210790 [Cutaneotrichosporon cavernicola]